LLQQLGRSGVPTATNPAAVALATPAGSAIAALLLSWAYPERVALQRPEGQGRYLLRNGRGAVLPPHDPLAHHPALAVGSVDGQGREARILLALPLSLGQLEHIADSAGTLVPHISWDAAAERVRCEQQRQLGALVLDRRPWPDPDPVAVQAVLVHQIHERGLMVLPWSPANRQLQQRLSLAHRHLGNPWLACDDETLLNSLETWLGPQLPGLRSFADLRQLDLDAALWGDLPWELRRELDQLLPGELSIASGRRANLDYSQGRPVLAVKLQELFGTRDHPTVLGGSLRVRLELLTPAGRPAAISEDLPHFWQHTYPEVRRELRGRYPKHPWPVDPTEAMATALTNRALKASGQGQR